MFSLKRTFPTLLCLQLFAGVGCETSSSDEGGGGVDASGGGGASAECALGEEEPCYNGPAGTAGVGICKSGLRVCGDDGLFGACQEEVQPRAETCETPDDEDCDGEANEDGSACLCVPGSIESCYTGPSDTAGVGLCTAGTHTCEASGVEYGACLGEVTPTQETCTVLGDEDCDGQTNEQGSDCSCVPGTIQDCYSANPDTQDVGVCHAGLQACNDDGLGYGACDGEVTPTSETCNNLEDDDCDGSFNEEGSGCACIPDQTVPCYTGLPNTVGVGACTAGAAICNEQGTALGPCTGEVLPSIETCITVEDDDCDGQVNESGTGCVCSPGAVQSCYTGPAGTSGIGQCVAGEQTCMASGLGFGTCLGDITPTAESCSTPIDEDCDGLSAASCTPTFLWSSVYGKALQQSAHEIATDAAGNVVIAGTFAGSVDFGGGPLVSVGAEDIFLAKFDGTGAHLWSKRFGGGNTDWGRSVAIDPSGNILITGDANSTSINFGGGTMSGGIFVAKYDPNGNHIWSKRFGEIPYPYGQSYHVATDNAGNVLITGYFTYPINFGDVPMTSAGGDDVFLAKLSSSGNTLWSRQFGGTGRDWGLGLTADSSGNVVVTGFFADTAAFVGGPDLSSAGGDDIFVAKFRPNGAHMWSKRFGNLFTEQVGDLVATDSSNNVFVVGRFRGSANFGGATLTSFGEADVFLTKLNAAGDHVWSHQYGNDRMQWGHGLSVDSEDNVAIAGYSINGVDFGGGRLPDTDEYDAYVAKFDGAGNHLWSQNFGGPDDQYAYSLASDPDDNLYVTGDFRGSMDFDGTFVASAGGLDSFIIKLGP